VDHLREIVEKEEIKAEKAALQVIAQKSEGCMRDALSILDKIVSFTNGVVTYQNTLEHLNILDADYFFKLLDAMQQQDLAAAMLLYDDINRKGFEGDMVLNAMAEFFRNLLVCKDEKVAGLLDAVESFKDKYINAAGSISSSWIISALNVLNEAEINFKQARNKRLHVELTLIKLTYLQQALDMATGKKKLNEKAKALQFRAIKPILADLPAISESAAPAKLIIETPAAEKQPPRPAPAPTPVAVPVPSTVSQGSSSTTSKPSVPLSKLSKLREQFASAPQMEQQALDLTEEQLTIAWREYILKLKTAQKHSVVTNFEMMECSVKTAELVNIRCFGELQLGFLKQERTHLLDHLQHFFRNPALNIHPELVELPDEQEAGPRPLSTREQYQKMVEKYPLVKDLKDRLGMELDY